MRTIKFRAKSVPQKEWIYGFLCFAAKAFGMPLDSLTIQEFNKDGGSAIAYRYIDEQTIGQFTGLKDINGKDIYEGDIIKDNNEFPFNGNYIVTWDNYYSRFQCNSTKTDGYLCLHDFAKPIVIGNIYDNPELIVPNLQ